MKQTDRKILDRVLAIVLCLMMVIAMVPVNVFAAENVTPAVMETHITDKVITVNKSVEFDVDITANDFEGETVTGSIVFSDEDAVETLKYLNASDGQWHQIENVFGPDTGFLLENNTARFSVTFNKAGTYNLQIALIAMADNSVVCSVQEDVTVGRIDATLKTDITEKSFNVGEETVFAVTTVANDYAGEKVMGSFEFSDPTAIKKLEYIEADGKWYELIGDFGPEGGFPLSDATSYFRVTFDKKGTYNVTININSVDSDETFCSVTEKVEVEHKVTVSSNKMDHGSIKINGQAKESVVVDAGQDVTVEVTPDNGYQIESVKIDGAEEILTDKNSFKATLKAVAANKSIEVTFVEIFTVTVTYDGKGNVEMTPEGESGKVVVEVGKNVDVSAVPETGYRVSEVVINNRPQKVTGANDSKYEKTLSATKNQEYIVHITFAKNVYEIEANKSENGKVIPEKNTAEYGSAVKVYVLAEENYTVDAILVNNSAVTEFAEDEGGIFFIINDIKEAKTINSTFKKISSADSKNVVVDSSKDLRKGELVNTYVIKEGDSIDFSTEKSGIRLWDANGNLIAGDENSQAVSVNSNVSIAKVELYYQDADEYFAHWHTVVMNDIKIVVDTDGLTATLTPVTDAINGYYNSDVTLKVNANDADDYSGLALVEYWITFNGVDGDKKTLYSYDGDNIVGTYSDDKAIVINANLYNSQNVKVNLHVVDRAGNEITEVKELKINSTKPTVSLSLDGSEHLNAQEGYYQGSRTLKINILDRADTFSVDYVLAGLEIYRNGSKVKVEKDNLTCKSTDSLHECTYTFSEDGHYTWSFSYTNKAGLTNEKSSDEVASDFYDFYIDNKAPENLKVSYSKEVSKLILENLTFGFYKSSSTVTIEAVDETSGVAEFTYSYKVNSDASAINNGKVDVTVSENDITYNGNKASASFVIPPEFCGKISFSVMDKAGNTAEMIDENKVVVVDSVAPGVTVTYDNNNAINNNYFNANRTATIKINEANFFEKDIEDGLLVITVERTLDGGKYTKENIKPAFTKDGDVYTATVEFNENADYTFDIKYTDRSGNVFDSYDADSFTIDKSAPVVSVEYINNKFINEYYFDKERTAKITIAEHNFDPANVNAVVTVNGVKDDSFAKVLSEATSWTHIGNKHIAEITFSGDALYTLDIICTDLADNESDGVNYINSEVPELFYVDKTAPKELKISYEPSFINKVLEGITFGFYQAPVTVTIEATDKESGVDYFTYSYIVEDKASAINQGKKEVKVDVPASDSDTSAVSFDIPAQFRGNVSFSAIDMAGNSSETNDTNVVVVDDVAPGIQVTYDNNNAKNGNYYSADRKATIVITEANYFEDDINDGLLVITVGKKLVGEKEYTYENPKPVFSKKGDVYTATIDFNEDADYTFDISYTDRSGNVYDSYDMDEFTIDKVAPMLSMTYDNNECYNGKFYKADRTATIRVDEHNFRADKIVAEIVATDVTGKKEIDLSSKDYANYLKNQNSWKSDGDIWTADIKFDIEGDYDIKIEYKDLAENAQASIIQDDFCIDKSAPENLKIDYDPGFVGVFLEKVFGFYKDSVKVTIEATDEYAGVDYFEYSYDVADDASVVNKGKTKVKVDAIWDNNTNRYYATFDIPAQFRGNVSFDAIDFATNTNTTADENIVVVDNVAPGITVTYDNNDAKNGNYYSADRVATIVINEANFFEDDIKDGLLVITKTTTYDDGTMKEEALSPEFSKDGDVYTATVKFDENADYTFDIKYTDRSGNVYDSYDMDKFTVDKIAPEMSIDYDNKNAKNGKYYDADRKATITVDEHNFRASDFVAVITATDVTGKQIDLSSKNYAEYLRNPDNWNSDGDIRTAEILFDIDGRYSVDLSYSELAGNEQVEKIVDDFVLDKTNPDNLEITYKTDFISTVLENITFGFYQSEVEVTIKAQDMVAGIDYFVYNYDVQKGASSTNIGLSGASIDEVNIENSNEYYAKFKIPAQFRGNVSFDAVDMAGNISNAKDKNVVVVDNVAPGISVTYDNNNVLNDKYYAADRTATIRIEEANFFKKDLDDGLLVITVEKTLDDGKYTKENIKPEFTKNGDVYTATVKFDENADYTFDIKYTDRSGNVYDSYDMDVFTIDKINPVINVEFGNDAINDNQFKADRVADIEVVEHNFDASTFDVSVTENGATNDEFQKELIDDLSWTHNGDVHTARIVFNHDAHYQFDIACKDLAGNANDKVNYGNSVFPGEFTVDKTSPSELKISYDSKFIEEVLEKLTFGFYKSKVKVRIEATDEIAGVDYFTYSCVVQEGASSTNRGYEEVIIDAIPIEGTHDSYAEFIIPAQFRGNVSFIATDKAGNTSKITDSNIVVVDNVAPGITVTYDNNNVKNGSYYDNDRTATIKIEEANFFETDIKDGLLEIVRTTTLNDGTFTKEYLTPKFTKDKDIYTATVKFDKNADYTFDIKYTDHSGNVFDTYEEDVFTVDKIKPEISISYNNNNAKNKKYYDYDRTATLTVNEHNFRAAEIEFDIEAFDVTGKKQIDLSSKNYEKYLQTQDNWTFEDGKWTASILLDIEGNYKLSARYTDLAGYSQQKEVKDEFCIDKSVPENLDITYKNSFVGVILETLTFGFYKAPVTVTLSATDEYAGVDYFVYSYEVQEGASSTNTGKTDVRVDRKDITFDGNKASISFKIDPQYRGNIYFAVTDMAGNSNDTTGDVVVVDNVAPGISVTYNQIPAFYKKYYNEDRVATIKITEANFFEKDLDDGLLVITVGKTYNDGTISVENIKPEFTKNGDVYTAKVIFNENADYTFDIKYTDRSGNVYDSYETDVFTIDKLLPVINVSYDNNSCNNNNQFKADREATIVITEHNFKASDVFADVYRNGNVVSEYGQYLAEEDSWTHDGDVHTARISYTDEGHYQFSISTADMANNHNSTVDYGTSVAPTLFTLDKSAPTELEINIDGVSVLGTNSVAFDKFYADTVKVELSANCDISGLESVKYQKVDSVSKYNENGNWIDYDAKSGIVVVPSEKFIIYLRAEDRAGNVSIVNSTGIVVDKQKPVGEVNAPDIDILPEASNKNGYYNGDVKLSLKVLEPKHIGANNSDLGYYSGLNNITYRIYTTDTDATEAGTLFDINEIVSGAVVDSDKLVKSWTGEVVVDATVFNSNNVYFEITAVDNAGNIRTTTTKAGELMIDITKPTIDVSYNNNTSDSTSYFKADRTATIVITERNFRPEDIVVNITNTDKVIPKLSTWKQVVGTENKDDTQWFATVTYSADGDYTFSIEYTDPADWKCSNSDVDYGDSVAPTKFTVDKVVPTVTVSYDNNSAQNVNYYSESRTATVVITEHNLEPNGADRDRINITLTATDDGAATTVPTVSSWRTSGNTHTATINYAGDARYTFDIAIKDKAGNNARDFEQQTFFVDKTAPSLEISGVEDKSANPGEVIPVVTYSDTNYDADRVEITLIGANRKNVELDGYYTDIHNGRSFVFYDFAEQKSVDDIYTLAAMLTDKAGNTTTKEINFSVNRFGSTYALSDSTEKLNNTYVKEATDVVVTEVNANKLSNIKVTLFKNNETILLKEGTDYALTVTGGNGQWYEYKYTILAKNFESDGVYSITIESDDEAGNMAKNDHDTKNTEINFGIDSTMPIINIENLESRSTYATENLVVDMSIRDNLVLSKVIVELDGKEIKVWSADELTEIVKDGGNFSFDIPGDSIEAHRLVVYAVDAAGNGEKISGDALPENAEVVDNFFVTTNLWVRYYTNKPLFFGTIGGVILIAGLIVFLVVYKKKKNEDE